jgi:hypothetical protein
VFQQVTAATYRPDGTRAQLSTPTELGDAGGIRHASSGTAAFVPPPRASTIVLASASQNAAAPLVSGVGLSEPQGRRRHRVAATACGARQAAVSNGPGWCRGHRPPSRPTAVADLASTTTPAGASRQSNPGVVEQ